jgi:hypothetical protein
MIGYAAESKTKIPGHAKRSSALQDRNSVHYNVKRSHRSNSDIAFQIIAQ